MRRLFALFSALLLLAAAQASAQPSGRILFNDNWSFEKEDQAPRTVNLPHDWGVESDFDITYPGATGRRWADGLTAIPPGEST